MDVRLFDCAHASERGRSCTAGEHRSTLSVHSPFDFGIQALMSLLVTVAAPMAGFGVLRNDLHALPA